MLYLSMLFILQVTCSARIVEAMLRIDNMIKYTNFVKAGVRILRWRSLDGALHSEKNGVNIVDIWNTEKMKTFSSNYDNI